MKIKYDPIHTNIPITKLEQKIINSGLFTRLQYIMQTSTSYLTFPSLRHSRYSHSLGTMHIAGKMFCNIIRNTEEDIINNLFNNIERIINEYILNMEEIPRIGVDVNIKGILKDLNKEDIFKFDNFKEKDFLIIKNKSLNVLKFADKKKNYLYYIILESIRLAGALHDVGHMPFSHLFEGVLQDLYGDLIDKKRKTKKEQELYELLNSLIEPKKCETLFYASCSNEMTIKEKEFLNLCRKNSRNNFEENYFKRLGDSTPIHEYLGELISILIFNEQLNNNALDDNQKILIFIIKMLVQMIYAEVNINGFDFKILHQIISGPIDADRLDYVHRDILHSGLNLISFDLNRIITNISYNKDYKFVFSSLVLSDIEKFFVSRYESYNEIIYHHKVIRTNRILEEILRDHIKDFLTRDNKKKRKLQSYAELDILFQSLLYIKNRNIFDKTKSILVNQFEENWLLRLLKINHFSLEKKNILKLKYLREVLDGEESFTTIWINKEVFKSDMYKYINSKEIYRDLWEKDRFKIFFDKYFSIDILEFFEEDIIKDVEKLNKKDFKILFFIRRFSLGTSGINNILIDFGSSDIKKLSNISQIEDRLRKRVLENIPILFFVDKKKKKLLKDKILKILSTKVMKTLSFILLLEILEEKEKIKNKKIKKLLKNKKIIELEKKKLSPNMSTLVVSELKSRNYDKILKNYKNLILKEYKKHIKKRR